MSTLWKIWKRNKKDLSRLGIQALGGENIYLPVVTGNTRALETLLMGEVFSFIRETVF
jgi:hypothetical protein